MMAITIEQIQEVANQVDSREFAEFAEKVTAIDEIAGTLAMLHADAADGNSPDVQDWVRGTFDDAMDCDAETVEEAREWWMNRYA